MDIESVRRWWDYTAAYQRMIQATHTPEAPWHIVPADDKRRARLNCITHLLGLIPYQDLTPDPIVLPPREESGYVRPPLSEQTFVPDRYA